MDARAASDNLQVIRTLMERAALYRLALAPIMLTAGVLGILAAAVGVWQHFDSLQAFGCLWLATAGVVVIAALLLSRRQALKQQEPFWSPPTRRVAQALLPALASGMFVGVVFCLTDADDEFTVLLALLWVLFYGCALHAAGFFMVRGIRWLGWLFIAGAFLVMGSLALLQPDIEPDHAHWLMGAFFGLLHLASGIYLYATEKRKITA